MSLYHMPGRWYQQLQVLYREHGLILYCVARLSTAPSNHGPKVTTAEPENRTSNGGKKSRLSPKQHSPAQLKRKKPGINKKSKPQKQLETEEETQDERSQNSLILALQIFPCIIPATWMPALLRMWMPAQ
ncbi:hypothetical protein K503DRAFT_860084 [Rhizopogon vinicolor AM-OR11-026]|uniref:Uncharacterized protein n=1 Tax=Rhizopogon vinicolor AM-OR11-026 TaxID=1314800 RepID=A0A1B7MJY7_9AGAM|nr:hypothetical protein K503DRAFT_860084 [Rhizopogon vinicolor AM-OR11-026]